MKAKEVALLVLVMYLFHIARNLTPFYYLLLGASILIFFVLAVCNSRRVKLDPLAFFILLLWLYASVLSVIGSEVYGDPLVGLIRLWTTIPLVFVALAVARGYAVVAAKAIALFFALAALSFVWQYMFGAVDWFAESSERAGGTRFASLAGSLTAYGTLVGFPVLVAVVYFSGVWRLCLVLLLVLGALMSLQKAAIANVVIALLIGWRLGAVRIQTIVLGGLVACIGFLSLLLFDTQAGDGIVMRFVIGNITSNSSLSADVSFFDSIIDRVTGLPAQALRFHGNETLVAGAGVFGGGGTLGYPEIPMAHNGLIEILAIFGYFVGGVVVIALISLLVFSVVSLMRRPSVAKPELGFISGSYFIWFLNYLFSGGGLFHPIGAAILWLIIFWFYSKASNTDGNFCVNR